MVENTCAYCEETFESARAKNLCDECSKVVDTCERCQKVVLKDEGVVVKRIGFLCEDCFKMPYFVCDKCGDTYPTEEAIKVTDETVCTACHDKFYRACHHCENEFPYDEDSNYHDAISYIESVGDYVCKRCIDRHYTMCDDCEELVPSDEIIFLGDRAYCKTCIENKFLCMYCGKNIHLHEHEDEGICNSCYEEYFKEAYDVVKKEHVMALYPDLQKRTKEMFLKSVLVRNELVGLTNAIRTLRMEFSGLVDIDFDALTYKEQNGTRRGELSALGSPRNYFYKMIKHSSDVNTLAPLISTIYNKKRDADLATNESALVALPKIIAALRYRIYNEIKHKRLAQAVESIRGIYKYSNDFYFEFSNDPIDILSKSTSQAWEKDSCEKFTGAYKEGPFSDIMNSNIVVFVILKNGMKVARIMVRWCMGDNHKIGFGIEGVWYSTVGKTLDDSRLPIYSGLPAYKAKDFIENILKERGFYDYGDCTTPYRYQGFSDKAGSGDTEITYKR